MSIGDAQTSAHDNEWPYKTSSVEKAPASGDCPECGGSEVRRYPVLSEGGWFMVEKCQECLASRAREPWNRLGWVSRDALI